MFFALMATARCITSEKGTEMEQQQSTGNTTTIDGHVDKHLCVMGLRDTGNSSLNKLGIGYACFSIFLKSVTKHIFITKVLLIYFLKIY